MTPLQRDILTVLRINPNSYGYGWGGYHWDIRPRKDTYWFLLSRSDEVRHTRSTKTISACERKYYFEKEQDNGTS